MTSPASTEAQARGVLAAALCYLTWGLVPLYWKLLADINALELIAHRHVWSLIFVAAMLFARGRLGEVRAALPNAGAVVVNLVSAILLTGNWLVYVWGVNTGHVVEASLGYFLAPLVNVAAGRFVLHEQLRPVQWFPISLAALGVTLMVVQVGRPPWIALALAATWGGYSLMRKKSPLGSLTGLTVETLLLAPAAVAFLLWRQHTGAGAFGHVSWAKTLLILSAGVITAVPLILFAYAARRIRLSTLGLLQYITPTAQFLLGVFVYHEPLPRERIACFGLIWVGLAFYSLDSIWAQRRRLAAA